MKLYIVEYDAKLWDNAKRDFIEDSCIKTRSHFTDYNTARKRAELLYKKAMDEHRNTSGDEVEKHTDIWLQEYDEIGGEFFYNDLRGHWTSWDFTGRLIFSYCN